LRPPLFFGNRFAFEVAGNQPKTVRAAARETIQMAKSGPEIGLLLHDGAAAEGEITVVGRLVGIAG
jgi:hypothetical protein